MEYKKFEIKLALQIILIIAVSLLVAYSSLKENLQFSTYYFIVLLAIQAYILYKYVHNKNQKFVDYIKTISNHDTDDKLRKTSYDINDELIKNISNNLSTEIQNLKQEKLFHEHYLSYVLESINIGILALNGNTIEFYNSAIIKLFKKEVQNTNHLDQLNISLKTILPKIEINHPKLNIFHIDGENIPVSIHLTLFKIANKEIKLYSFYNVKNELQENEINTWQEVIRVISHEIMNSISPIKSLSSTIYETLQDELNNNTIQKKQIENVLEGIEAIEKRSINLSDFVQNYKRLTKVPKPIIQSVSINNLLARITNLLKSEIDNQNIELKVNIEPENLNINADENLLEQIIINLLTNSIHALKETNNKHIELKAYKNETNSFIAVMDNGKGISENDHNKIFLPFYTTKKDGSGIGLSLAQQIMKLHGGNISVHSEPQHTLFTLTF